MPSSSSRRRRASRFDQLTPEQDKAYRGESAELLLTGKFRSFTGDAALMPFFEKALEGFEADVSGFRDAIILTDGFVLMCNARRKKKSKRTFEGYRSRLSCGVLAFAKAKKLHGEPVVEWPADLGKRLVKWLRGEAVLANGERYNENTSRKYYGEFCRLFAELAEQSKTSSKLRHLEPFPQNPFSGARDDTKKTKSLGLPVLIAILLAARAEFQQVVGKVRYAQALFAKAEVLPDLTKRSKLRYRNLDSLLWHLRKEYPERFPAFTSWREADLPLFEAINKLHGGWRNVGEYFHPLASSCVAPMLLMTIYAHFNTEPLRALLWKHIRKVSVLRTEHVQVRTEIVPPKNRGTPYTRSFPIDDSDFASPNSILELMKVWTRRIRADAGIYGDYVFILLTNEGEVKSFATAALEGRSGDSKWNNALKAFCKRHGFTPFNLMELRQTSLELGRLLSDGDIREVGALKGGSSQSTLEFHYFSDGAEKRSHATIAMLQATKERFVRTGGKSHHLGAQSKDVTGATPGCNCLDPYDSPIPGEVKGSLCMAFGSCPGCPLGSPQFGSAHGLARLLQLREALEKARLNLPTERWVARYKRALEVVNDSWIPMFAPELFEQVKRMSLQPIGVVE